MLLTLATVFLEHLPQFALQLANVGASGSELNPVVVCSMASSAVCIVLELGRKCSLLGLRRQTLPGGGGGGAGALGLHGPGGAHDKERELAEVLAVFLRHRVARRFYFR